MYLFQNEYLQITDKITSDDFEFKRMKLNN